MDLKTFFENFDTLAEAPGGIARLRELILDMAVRGKLVPQDPADESAEEIKKKISSQRKELISQKRKIRNPKTIPPVQLDEVAYPVPKRWKWERFGDVTICRDRERIPLSRESRQNRQGIYDYYGASGVIDKIDDFLFSEPLLLIGEDGANLINRSKPIAYIAQGKYWVNNHAHVLDGISHDYLRYLEIFVNSIDLNPYITGTAQPKMNQVRMNSIPVPLPPLSEQNRIVAKVDELMALCDRAEAAQQTRNTLRQDLRASALDALMNATSDTELDTAWEFVQNNWIVLSQELKGFNDLRQLVLKLAVEGKLLSAAEKSGFLSRKENFELLKAQRLSFQLSKKDENRIVEEFKRAEETLSSSASCIILPARCVCDFITKGTTPSKGELGDAGDIPYLKVYNIINNELNFFYKPSFISQKVHEGKLKRSRVLAGDVLMNIVGPPLGKVAIVPDTYSEWNLNQALAIFRPMPALDRRFLYYTLSSLATLKTVLNETRGTAGQDNLSLEQCRDLRIPLFTMEEQKSIVIKVDELMKQCDRLETTLRKKQKTAEALVASAISHLSA